MAKALFSQEQGLCFLQLLHGLQATAGNKLRGAGSLKDIPGRPWSVAHRPLTGSAFCPKRIAAAFLSVGASPTEVAVQGQGADVA